MSYFKLQAGCLAILLYIAFIYFHGCLKYHRKFRHSLFGKMIAIGIMEIFLDGATAYTVNYLECIPDMVNLILHLFFLLSIDATIFAVFMYILHITGLEPESRKGKLLIFLPFACNASVMIFTIGSLKYIKGKTTNYSMGIPVYCCYIMVAVYILLLAGVLIKRWNYINSDKHNGIITFFIVYSVITVVQMIFPEILISSLAITVMILGIYMNFEDPAVKELERYYSETVMNFATLIENRDSSTGGHIRRTAEYVRLIAEELRRNGQYKEILTKDYIENLLNAAPMHDIGKISVPDSILKKPGKLTGEEFEIMKRHASDGGNIIRETFGNLGNKEYCQIAYEVSRYHHEKWNGNGYPDGLKRNEIPLCARIMAIADVFDAVSERRCYRDSMPIEQCFEIIAQGSGQDFDPIIAETFLNAREKVVKIHDEFIKDTDMQKHKIS